VQQFPHTAEYLARTGLVADPAEDGRQLAHQVDHPYPPPATGAAQVIQRMGLTETITQPSNHLKPQATPYGGVFDYYRILLVNSLLQHGGVSVGLS
jgi:hypothetical protein